MYIIITNDVQNMQHCIFLEQSHWLLKFSKTSLVSTGRKIFLPFNKEICLKYEKLGARRCQNYKRRKI